MKGDLRLLKRIMFLLPVLLCITIANIVVVKHTRIRYPVSISFDRESTWYDRPWTFIKMTRPLPKPKELQGEAYKEVQKGTGILQEKLKGQTE